MLTKKKLRALAKEENMSASEYDKMGFKAFAKDEKRHARFFQMLLKKKKK